MLTLNEVNEKYFDVLKEIGNIGAGNATTAIANMLGLRIDMSVPEVAFLPVEELLVLCSALRAILMVR